MTRIGGWGKAWFIKRSQKDTAHRDLALGTTVHTHPESGIQARRHRSLDAGVAGVKAEVTGCSWQGRDG